MRHRQCCLNGLSIASRSWLLPLLLVALPAMLCAGELAQPAAFASNVRGAASRMRSSSLVSRPTCRDGTIVGFSTLATVGICRDFKISRYQQTIRFRRTPTRIMEVRHWGVRRESSAFQIRAGLGRGLNTDCSVGIGTIFKTPGAAGRSMGVGWPRPVEKHLFAFRRAALFCPHSVNQCHPIVYEPAAEISAARTCNTLYGCSARMLTLPSLVSQTPRMT